jgi:hypothetical protein
MDQVVSGNRLVNFDIELEQLADGRKDELDVIADLRDQRDNAETTPQMNLF